jgi:CDP-4-dehydro-6-deoxyglucose reductase, E3
VSAGENVLGAALAAGIPLPHSCRAGRCASCKARLVSGEIAYPDDRLPPGIVAAEAASGEVLLCQAQPRSDLLIQTRQATAVTQSTTGVVVQCVVPLSTGGQRVTLRFLGAAPLQVHPGQFIDVENAAGERERVPVVAIGDRGADVEVLQLDAQLLVRARGPFDSPR